MDSNQRRLSQRIYSPSPLTTRAPLRDVPPTGFRKRIQAETSAVGRHFRRGVSYGDAVRRCQPQKPQRDTRKAVVVRAGVLTAVENNNFAALARGTLDVRRTFETTAGGRSPWPIGPAGNLSGARRVRIALATRQSGAAAAKRSSCMGGIPSRRRWRTRRGASAGSSRRRTRSAAWRSKALRWRSRRRW